MLVNNHGVVFDNFIDSLSVVLFLFGVSNVVLLIVIVHFMEVPLIEFRDLLAVEDIFPFLVK